MNTIIRSISVLVTAFIMLPIFSHAQNYVPTQGNLKARQEFSEDRFGIFIHWGLYSIYAQGEWYLQNVGLHKDEYAKSASAFYPHAFDARQWVSAFKEAGAKYVCLTSRHHDGFSMWDTGCSEYNIVDATPYGRDIVKELSEECAAQGMKFYLYYSLIDWTRDDYPLGRVGRKVQGRDKSQENYDSYFNFMKLQLAELLTKYEVGAIWFDGLWDHDSDATPFDWRLDELYAHIHDIRPDCLIGNNHHLTPFEGEDFQMFERDLPGENTTGWASEQTISKLPLETCQTMNNCWGYAVKDQDYKSTETLLRLLVTTAGKNANLLLNVGPQPNGEIPATALLRLKEMGEWLRQNGDAIYGTVAGDIPEREWGVTTRKGDRLFLHIFDCKDDFLSIKLDCKVKSAVSFADKSSVKFRQSKDGIVTLLFDEKPSGIDYIVELETRQEK